DSVDRSRVRIAQAPGGTGSLWVLMQLINRARPGTTVWVSDPTWPNHNPIAINSGLQVKTYPYFDTETRGVKFAEMLAALDKLGKDDVVLLHGCCHNPTGANLTNAQWDQVAASLARTGALPFIDLAYLGFGDGLLEDAYGTRKVIAAVPEALIAFSGSKNFGLYRERVGAAILIARDAAQADVAQSQLLNIIRGAYSQPPDHGAEIIRTILEDPELRAEWEAELDQMRARMIGLREKLSAAIRQRSDRSASAPPSSSPATRLRPTSPSRNCSTSSVAPIASRPIMAPKSSAPSSRMPNCAPNGRPSSTRCAPA